MAALLVAGAAIVVAFALLRPAPPAPFVVLHGPFHFPVSFRDRLDRFIPPKASWRWVWNLEQRFFGARKPVLIKANIVSCDSPPVLLSNLALGPPNFSDTNGLSIWLLGSNQVSALRGNFNRMPEAHLVNAPRIASAEGIEATIYVGGSAILQPPLVSATPASQVSFGCTARFRRNSTDLLTHITVSELVTKDNDAIDTNGYGPYGYAPPTITVPQTNLDAALRLQLPKGTVFSFSTKAIMNRRVKTLAFSLTRSRQNAAARTV